MAEPTALQKAMNSYQDMTEEEVAEWYRQMRAVAVESIA